MIRVTIWNEFVHERRQGEAAAIYPDGIHAALAKGLEGTGFVIRTATMGEPEHGLGDAVLAATDVLVWWGHLAHHEVSDAIVNKVNECVLNGMGLIVLHSGHCSKIFNKLMGTQTCKLKWREADEKERLWVVNPAHPITDGVPEYIELEKEEMYGEHFDVPAPDELIFVSWFEGGEVFRSGMTYTRGRGKIFYFRPGHETYPTYYNKDVLRVIRNAAVWAAPMDTTRPTYGNTEPLEEIGKK